jgi:hypothetical protein
MASLAGGKMPVKLNANPTRSQRIMAAVSCLTAVTFKGHWIKPAASRKEVGFDPQALRQAEQDAKFWDLPVIHGTYEKATLESCFPTWVNDDRFILSLAMKKLANDEKFSAEFVSGSRSASEDREWVRSLEKSASSILPQAGTKFVTDKDDEILEFAKHYALAVHEKLAAVASAKPVSQLSSATASSAKGADHRRLCEEIDNNRQSYKKLAATEFTQGKDCELGGYFRGTQLMKIEVQVKDLAYWREEYFFEGGKLLAASRQMIRLGDKDVSEWTHYFKEGKLFKRINPDKTAEEPGTEDFRYAEKNMLERAAEFQKALQEKGSEATAPKPAKPQAEDGAADEYVEVLYSLMDVQMRVGDILAEVTDVESATAGVKKIKRLTKEAAALVAEFKALGPASAKANAAMAKNADIPKKAQEVSAHFTKGAQRLLPAAAKIISPVLTEFSNTCQSISKAN